MKTKITISILFVLFTANLFAQSSITDVFSSTETKITWLGIDYSQVKIMGPFAEFGGAGAKDNIKIRDKYFKGWNQLIINEREKYNFGRALNKTKVPYDIGYMEKRNDAANVENLFSTSSEDADRFKEEDIKKIVSQYRLDGKSGIGLVFIAEALDKPGRKGTFWVTFIDMASSQVLLTEKMSGESSGLGLKNFWAGSVYKILKDIEVCQYRKWKNKYIK